MWVHILVSGTVQGVFYRASTKQKSDALGVKGWVRNLLDGRVEMMAAADKEQLDALIQWCREGPPMANVTNIEIVWSKIGESYDEFTIKRSHQLPSPSFNTRKA